VREVLRTWAAAPDAIPAEAVERYVGAFTPEAIAGICAEFRAAFHIDRPMDAEQRERGPKIACPVLVHWGASEGAMTDGPMLVWRRWAEDVRGGPLRSGHFVPEEAAEQLAGSLRDFLRE
jgi:haloacetate dehalogenase